MEISENAIRIAEDDFARSNHVRELLHRTGTVASASSRDHVLIPKVIVQFWHDSNAIPTDVEECLQSWQQLETCGFQRQLFNDDTAKQFIETTFSERHLEAFNRCHHPAMRSDYFRLCYIFSCGGFYVDADEIYQGASCNSLFHDNRLKLQPLCYDKGTNSMVVPDVFLESQQHSPDWIYYVNNNPLIGPQGHAVLAIALKRATGLLLNSREPQDIQSTTGPGNLSASLVMHSLEKNKNDDVAILSDWTSYSISPWPLSYRNDQRNWRLWNPQGSNERI